MGRTNPNGCNRVMRNSGVNRRADRLSERPFVGDPVIRWSNYHDATRVLRRERDGGKGNAGCRVSALRLNEEIPMQRKRQAATDGVGLFLGGDNEPAGAWPYPTESINRDME